MFCSMLFILSNILIHGDILKLGDFGLSKVLEDSHSITAGNRGTIEYMCVELFDNLQLRPDVLVKIDIW